MMKKSRIFSVCVIVFLIVVIGFFYVSFKSSMEGTPDGKAKARSEFEHYLSKNFSQNIAIDKVEYNWKGDNYWADVHVKGNEKLHFVLLYNGKEVSDDYVVNSWSHDISNKLGNKVATIFKNKAALEASVFESVGVFPDYEGDNVPDYFALQKESLSRTKELSQLTYLEVYFTYNYKKNDIENQKLYKLIGLIKKEIPYADIELKYKSTWFTLEHNDFKKISSYKEVPKYFKDNSDLLK